MSAANLIRAVVAVACLGIGSSAVAATTADSGGNENDTLYKAIYDLCINARGTADDAAQYALRAPYRPRDMDASFGPLAERVARINEHNRSVYERRIGLLRLGYGSTLLIFRATSRSAPLAECRFNAESQDVADIAARLRAAFALPEPVNESDSDDWRAMGRTSLQGRSMTISLLYSLRKNEKSGVLTFTANSANVNEMLLHAIRDLCIKPNGTVDESAKRATRAPFNAIDTGHAEGTPYARSVQLAIPGRGRTKILLIGASPSAPVKECHFTTSDSYDLTELIAQLRTVLVLSEPTKDSDGFWKLTGHSSADGRPADIDVAYRSQGNEITNFFHLHVSR
jgi:hypothetical protein